ncbi:MAG: 3-methylornithyl-N6-L-lysine dehydrogenase PylD [Desulfobacter sp.]|nr:MAG: 3-methylornithyl-N6-L-lysine dehydrogenase PylD [Desulfobacter sp.]
MTRLKTSDISGITSRLDAYDRYLQAAAHQSLAGVACHAWGVDPEAVASRIKRFAVYVIPVTAGQGIITRFSETVGGILQFLGCDAIVTEQTDASGLAQAFERKADAIMMADDYRFVGINLHTREVVDNAVATGRAFAAVLDLMAGGIKDQTVLVMGCGPVGEAGAGMLLEKNARVGLYDTNYDAARSLEKRLDKASGEAKIEVHDDFTSQCRGYSHILEATPQGNTIPDEWITDRMRVAAPGVPLGLSGRGADLLQGRLIHDKLELGVAAMAVKLIISSGQGD